MADLNDNQAAQTVKLIGADSSSVETNPVNASANGELKVSDISDNSGVQGAITVTSTASEAKVGGATLANRKNLTVFNNSNIDIYWGYTSGVTTSSGTPIFKSQLMTWDVGANTKIYLISASGSNNVRVTENA